MRTASKICSIITILFCWLIYIAIPFGILAIIFARLARRRDSYAYLTRRTTIVSLAGMILSVVITGYAFYAVYSDPQLKAQFDRIVAYYTGELSDEILEGENSTVLPEDTNLPDGVTLPEGATLPEGVILPEDATSIAHV